MATLQIGERDYNEIMEKKSNKEKVQAAIDRIRSEGFRDERVNPNEIYKAMREYTLDEIAEEITKFINMMYDVRDILEGEK